MVTTDELRPLRTKSDGYAETQSLKATYSALRQHRKPFFLTTVELDEIFRWKLERQFGRQAALRKKNSPALYQAATQACFAIELADKDDEARLRLGLLTAIPGIGVPVASAILALVDPDHYCVIDFRGWRAMFGITQESFSIAKYLRYLAEIRQLAVELNWCIQETDMAVWLLDQRRQGALV